MHARMNLIDNLKIAPINQKGESTKTFSSKHVKKEEKVFQEKLYSLKKLELDHLRMNKAGNSQEGKRNY